MPITSLILQIGSVLFTNFEVPEKLSGLGGTQSIAEHRFPGGIITHQTFGAFPNHISFGGLLLGTNALPRMREMDRLRVVADVVPFIYGGTQLLGIVTEFSPEVKHQWLVSYTLKFQPGTDLSTGSPLDEFTDAFSVINDALIQLNTMVGILFSSSDGPTHAASGNYVEVYMPLPPTMGPPIQNLINLTYDALQAALGLPANISQGDGAAIIAQAAAIQVIADPYVQGIDPTLSSAALDALGYVNTIVATVTSPQLSDKTIISVINPNIRRIAAEYYGDSSKWQTITDASGLSPDPQPIGSFDLTIPNV